ncbi:MAG: mycothione reductase [Marmoricola sp.]
MTHYDLAVIGTGSGNSIVNEELADRRVAILERGVFGGTCLNVGCIPTKMFVYPADVARSAAHGPDLGLDTRFEDADWPAIRDRIFARVDAMATVGKAYREGLPNVDVYTGSCRFTGPRQIDTGTGQEITADQVVIAAGSRAVVPDIPGLDTVEHHTSDTVMRLAHFPARVGIIGGGFVAAEFAHIFSAYGAQVTQVHRGSRLLAQEDDEISARFTQIVQQQWGVRLRTTLTSVQPAQPGPGIVMHLDDASTVEVDVLLLATGRRPNSDQLDLATTGVEVSADGRVVVDEHQRTTAEGIWALGDISSPDQLKHVANQDARVVQHNLLHPDDLVTSNHGAVPSAVFSSPQVASVGLAERAARERGIDVVAVTQAYGDVAYGWAMEDHAHLVKLVADRSTGMLVGAHLVGPQASILIQPLIAAMSFGQPVAGLARGQYWIHPALSEVVENALLRLESLLGRGTRL